MATDAAPRLVQKSGGCSPPLPLSSLRLDRAPPSPTPSCLSLCPTPERAGACGLAGRLLPQQLTRALLGLHGAATAQGSAYLPDPVCCPGPASHQGPARRRESQPQMGAGETRGAGVGVRRPCHCCRHPRRCRCGTQGGLAQLLVLLLPAVVQLGSEGEAEAGLRCGVLACVLAYRTHPRQQGCKGGVGGTRACCWCRGRTAVGRAGRCGAASRGDRAPLAGWAPRPRATRCCQSCCCQSAGGGGWWAVQAGGWCGEWARSAGHHCCGWGLSCARWGRGRRTEVKEGLNQGGHDGAGRGR